MGLNAEWDTEGQDRPNMELPGLQNELIERVAAANPRAIVVLQTGGPITMPWLDRVAGVLQAWYPGQECGNAIADVLFGAVNPSGKLPQTFPVRLEDNPAFINYPGEFGRVRYGEGIFVGYRYYDKKKIAPLFPFGHGLSYTSFSYAHLQVAPETTDGTQEIRVSFEVTNTGRWAGIEIAQVYLGRTAGVAAPPKQLAGWARVSLEPGESKQVTIVVNPQSLERPLSYWNTSTHGWEIAPGDYPVYVGASSRDIRLNDVLHILTSESSE
jgi:beta-glucosidase